MRRSPLAVVGGVVCALVVAGAVGMFLVARAPGDGPSRQEVAPPALASHASEGIAGKKDTGGTSLAAGGEAAPPSAMAQAVKAPALEPAAKKEAPGPWPAPAAAPSANKALSGLGTGMGSLGGALGARGTGAGGGGIGSIVGIGNIGTKGRGGGMASYGSGSGLGLMGKGGTVVLGGKTNPEPEGGTEAYRDYGVNSFVSTAEDRLSTFAVDVDTASYTLARRKVLEGTLPPQEAVRVEEFLNYFRYTYADPADGPLAVHLDAAPSPFTSGRHLLRVGVQGRHLSVSERKPAHLTFLVDVSGSMSSPDRLPLAKRALRMLVDQLRDGDTVALVTYAGAVRRVLPPTGMEQKARIHAAIEDLSAGGSTAMASGIELAYQQALLTLDGQSVSRVLILSDGDANVGPTSHEDILKLIRGHVKEGITVTTVGFGMGNYKDTTMEQLADKGNGNHYYVDSLMAARRIFQEQLGGTLEVIAQDVKLQVEFDPAQVARYRLVGYENRDIADRDFRNDRVDAGEIGAGHTVTALYELELKPGAGAGLATVRVRAKRPRGETATEQAYRLEAQALAPTFAAANPDLRFATAVMGAAELLRRSPHAERWSLERVLEIARGATPAGNAEREEFVALLESARPLMRGVAAR